jgi:hypothetical protein
MRLSTSLAALAAAICLTAAYSDTPLLAQWDIMDVSEYAKSAPRPRGATPKTDREMVNEKGCSPFNYTVTYPLGMDGGGPVDKAVSALAARFMAKAKAEGEEAVLRFGPCDKGDEDGDEAQGEDSGYAGSAQGEEDDFSEGSLFTRYVSSPYRVSGKAYSVLFYWSKYLGGAHMTMGYASTNLMADGTEITLGKLFPDPAKSLPLLWEAVYRGYCDSNSFPPNYYGGSDLSCGADVPPLPDPLKSPEATLDAAGHMLLTSLGLSVHLGPYEAYSFAEGPQFRDIPKEELLRMGADPNIWQ